MAKRKILASLLPALLVAGCTTTPVETPPPGPALLQVTDEDTTIYLFGFIDALDPGLAYRTEFIEAALENSDALVTATPVDPDADYSHILEWNRLSDGTTTFDFLDREQARAFRSAVRSFGKRSTAWDHYRPAFLGWTLDHWMRAEMGLGGINTVELEFKEFVGPSKDAGSIIDCATDFGFDQALTNEEGARFLAASSRNIAGYEDRHYAKEAAWMSGDLETMAELITVNLREAGLTDHYIRDRSRLYADWIEKSLSAPGTIFLTVLASELAAPDGLLDHLEERGIDAERVYSVRSKAVDTRVASLDVAERCNNLG